MQCRACEYECLCKDYITANCPPTDAEEGNKGHIAVDQLCFSCFTKAQLYLNRKYNKPVDAILNQVEVDDWLATQ